MEIGPGTGYFIKKYQFENLLLVDINDDVLTNSKNNLINNSKNIKIINKNVFENNNKLTDDISSIGLSYVLHCIPHDLNESVNNLVENINTNNKVVIFGSTVIPNKMIF